MENAFNPAISYSFCLLYPSKAEFVSKAEALPPSPQPDKPTANDRASATDGKSPINGLKKLWLKPVELTINTNVRMNIFFFI